MNRAAATLFGLGHLRPAPGTWASAAAVALGLVLHGLGGFPLLALATVATTILGFRVCTSLLAGQPGADPAEVVIDEVAGQWVALCFPSAGFWLMGLDPWRFPWPGWLGAFLFFRLFDIWKPWIVGRADARGDAAGVMLDDLWAGLLAGIATMVAGGLYHAAFL